MLAFLRPIASPEAASEWTVGYATQRVFGDRCTELHLRNELDAVDAAFAEPVSAALHGQGYAPVSAVLWRLGYMTEVAIARSMLPTKAKRKR